MSLFGTSGVAKYGTEPLFATSGPALFSQPFSQPAAPSDTQWWGRQMYEDFRTRHDTEPARVIGNFVNNRLPEDWPVISRFLQFYFMQQEPEIRALEIHLGKDRKDIKFTIDEAMIIHSRNAGLTQGIIQQVQGQNAQNTQPSGYPFQQLYDYIATMESVLTRMRTVYVDLLNMHVPRPEILDGIKQLIGPTSNLTWDHHETYTHWFAENAKRSQQESTRRYVGSASGSSSSVPSSAGSATASAAAAAAAAAGSSGAATASSSLPAPASPAAPASAPVFIPDPRGLPPRIENDYDLSCQEAVMLSFGLWNDIKALMQGLFTVHQVTARAWGWNLNLMEVDESKQQNHVSGIHNLDRNNIFPFMPLGPLGNETINSGFWINAYKGDHPWHGVGQGAEIERTPDPNLILKKYTKLEGYPNNVYTKQYTTGSAAPQLDTHKYDNEGNVNGGNVVRDSAKGGAIAEYLFVYARRAPFYDDDRGNGVVLKQTGRTVYSNNNIRNRDETQVPLAKFNTDADKNVYVRKLNISDLYNAYQSLPWHPISACKRLSEAFIQSGLYQLFYSKYTDLQRMLMEKVEQLDARNTDSYVAIAARSNLQIANQLRCQPGYTRVFKDRNGVVLKPHEAVLTDPRTQKRYLASNVDPAQTSCQVITYLPDEEQSSVALRGPELKPSTTLFGWGLEPTGGRFDPSVSPWLQSERPTGSFFGGFHPVGGLASARAAALTMPLRPLSKTALDMYAHELWQNRADMKKAAKRRTPAKKKTRKVAKKRAPTPSLDTQVMNEINRALAQVSIKISNK